MGGLLLLFALLAVGSPEVQVGDLDGRTTVGNLTAIAADKVTVETPDGAVEVPANRLLYLAPNDVPGPPVSAEKPTAWIELTDGSILKVGSFTIKKNVASVAIAGRPSEIPTSAIRKVRFSDPDSSQSPSWPADVGKDSTSDLLSVRTKDGGVDFLEGKVGDITNESVVFQSQGETVPAKRSKIDGMIIFHKADDTPPATVCVVQDAAGNRFNAKAVSLVDNSLQVGAASGVSFTVPWVDVARLDYSVGKVVYLSDLEPQSMRWTPYFDFGTSAPALAQFYAPRRDMGLDHQPLRLAGQSFSKGVALASRTEISYRLPAGVKKFKATAGIDDSVRDVGRVRLEISLDGKKMVDQAITGKQSPVDLDFDISGARRLSILVDFGADSDVGDFLNLADARMLK